MAGRRRHKRTHGREVIEGEEDFEVEDGEGIVVDDGTHQSHAC